MTSRPLIVSFSPSIISPLLDDDDAIVLREWEDGKICDLERRARAQSLRTSARAIDQSSNSSNDFTRHASCDPAAERRC
jgi:hypothetical protein